MERVKVFYSPRQTARRNESFSPSAGKPALVVAGWKLLDVPIEVVEPRPAELEDLCRAHESLGGILTSEQLARRDRMVFERCRLRGVPVVTNLAGGYQQPVSRVVAIHVETMRQFAEASA